MPQHLASLAFDPDPGVRFEMAARLPAGQLYMLATDSEAAVRTVVVERIAASELAPFLDDPDDVIRELACDRLVAVSKRHVSRVMGLWDELTDTNPTKDQVL